MLDVCQDHKIILDSGSLDSKIVDNVKAKDILSASSLIDTHKKIENTSSVIPVNSEDFSGGNIEDSTKYLAKGYRIIS